MASFFLESYFFTVPSSTVPPVSVSNPRASQEAKIRWINSKSWRIEKNKHQKLSKHFQSSDFSVSKVQKLQIFLNTKALQIFSVAKFRKLKGVPGGGSQVALAIHLSAQKQKIALEGNVDSKVTMYWFI